jgi:hypothetical protein
MKIFKNILKSILKKEDKHMPPPKLFPKGVVLNHKVNKDGTITKTVVSKKKTGGKRKTRKARK